MDWLDRENRKKDAPGTWLFGWFLLFVVIWGLAEHTVGTIILLVIAGGWYIRRQWEREGRDIVFGPQEEKEAKDA